MVAASASVKFSLKLGYTGDTINSFGLYISQITILLLLFSYILY